jgi:RNA polymerase sigma-70 factor (TIGR02960 family)
MAARLASWSTRFDASYRCIATRMLGSAQDAEDALQETLLAAWRGLRGFEERASVRTWLYRIATSRCLNALRSAGRRPRSGPPVTGLNLPEPSGHSEVVWLQPYPDVLLEGVPADAPGPEARYQAREAISLAFITAVQLLPARQRAVLILRDVLGYSTHEVADMLDSSEQAIASALKRARATLRQEISQSEDHLPPPAPNSPAEQKLVAAFTHAYSTPDVQSLVAFLAEDVRVSMPPWPFEYRGRDLAAQFHTAVTFRDGRSYRLIPTRGNGQPAFGLYTKDPHASVLHANGLMVLTLAGDHISALTRFDNSVLPSFGLARTLPSRNLPGV